MQLHTSCPSSKTITNPLNVVSGLRPLAGPIIDIDVDTALDS
jgi:hypothetical protein